MKFLSMCGWALFSAAIGVSAASAQGFVGTSRVYSDAMFDRQNTVTDKLPLMLRARQRGDLESGMLYVGGRFLGTYLHETTNTAGKFPILSRFPSSHTSGTSSNYGVINEASLNATLTLPMVTAFVQGEYTELAFPTQPDVQLRKYWLALGDLDRSPFYAAVGRKTVNFGDFSTYAPFTHNHSTHYFWAQAEEPIFEFGYVTDRTEVAVSLISEHRGFRVLSSPADDGGFENFAVNLRHRLDLGTGMHLRLGAGFLRGTIYDSAIAFHPPNTGVNRIWNGAWNVNATLNARRFDVMGEFTQTEHAWPATGHKVTAMTLQGRYRSELFNRPTTYSLAASRGVQGPKGSQWEKMDQVILGLEVEAAPNVSLGAEYVFNAGFVPLIMPTVVSDAGVRSRTFILGAKLTF